MSLALVVFFSRTSFTSAQSAADIQNKNLEIQRLEKEIAEYQKKLDAASKESNTLKGHIKKLDLTKSKLSTDLTVTTTKVEQTTEKIADLSQEISSKEQTITRNQKVLAEMIRGIHERGNETFTETLLAEDSFSSLWRELDQSIQLQNEIQSNLQELQGVKENLEGDKTEAETIRIHLNELQVKLADQKKVVEQNISEKNTLLKETKNKESDYQRLLAERVARKAALDAEIRAYESKLKYDYNPKALPLPGSHPLAWPLDSVTVTQQFGKTVAAKRLYTSGSHSGTDFRAAVGTPVKAMANGVVQGTGDTDSVCPGASFGKWVYIKYDNGLASAYGHLSVIKATVGQRVATGDIVGYSGNTGHSTGPHLHVTVYDGNASKVTDRPSSACNGKTYHMPLAPTAAYLDPLLYLPAR